MRVLYDGQIYELQIAGGINRYFANVICRLPASYAPLLVTRQAHQINYPAHPNLKVFSPKKSSPGYVSYRLESKLWNLYAKIENYYVENFTAPERFNIAHPTYYSLVTNQEVSHYRCPVVLTVWDMIHELFPEDMDPTGRKAEEKRRAITAAQAIICISENTKKDLLERYSLPENQVTVTYLASQINASLAYGSETVPDSPYYLFVGSRAAYKNFDRLLMAFAKVASVQPKATLCVVGASFNRTEENRLVDLQLTSAVENYGYVNDTHLAKLYRCSTAFVYPSLYEGFGIPPLEAMLCGTVVVASDCSSIPEVVGDAGLLFNPTSTGDLADILLDLIDNEAARKRFINKGFLRGQTFNWNRTADQTLDVYRSVCS